MTVFLSYSRYDSAFVEELYRRLTRDGVVCFYDQESIAWGSNWVRELEQGLEEADLVVVVLTPAFIESKWAELERTASLATYPDSARRRIRPLLRTECARPVFLRPIQSIDVTTDERFESSYPRICRELGGTLRADSLPAERSRLPPAARLPSRHRMPYRSLGAGFAGRIGELWELHDALSANGVAVVAGLGGLGKTQLATEYAHRFAGFYPGGIFWADAEQGIETVIHQIATAAEIQIDGKRTIDEQREQLYNTLARAPASVLLVFDNVPESGAVMPWLPPQPSIRALITTRRRDLSRFDMLPLQPLDEVAGLDLLNKGTRRFDSDATQLVKALGGLPLALELARNFLESAARAFRGRAARRNGEARAHGSVAGVRQQLPGSIANRPHQRSGGDVSAELGTRVAGGAKRARVHGATCACVDTAIPAATGFWRERQPSDGPCRYMDSGARTAIARRAGRTPTLECIG